MPIYEFLCPACNLLETFFSKRPSSALPRCPHCGGALEREVPEFSTGPSGPRDDAEGLGGSSIDPDRAVAAERALGAALDAAAGSAGDNPRAAAKAARAFSCASGISFSRAADALLRMVESGGDPDAAGAQFEQMVDAGEDFFADRPCAAAASRPARRPRRDPEWHDMPPDPTPAPQPGRARPGPWDAT